MLAQHSEAHRPMPSTTGTRGEKLAQRLSCILARLHQGEALDKHQLVQQFDVDVRTIERDLVVHVSGLDGGYQPEAAAQPQAGRDQSNR